MNISIDDWKNKFENYLYQQAPQQDKSHDVAHFSRVWATAKTIMNNSQANELVVLAACYFHDIVNLPKNHPKRNFASRMAADKTLRILESTFPDFPKCHYPAIHHAISAHSYSAQISPESIEAKIVQDADRLDALGAIGLARVFYIAGALDRELFDSDDPFAQNRQLDDSRFTLDHFQQKLLRLPLMMNTDYGRLLARKNADFLVNYMAKLSAEIQGDFNNVDNTVIKKFSFHD